MCKPLILGWDDFFNQNSQRFAGGVRALGISGTGPPDPQDGFCTFGPVQRLARGSCSFARKAGMTGGREE